MLGARPGVLEVEANAVAQTATVTFDPRRTSVAELRDWVIECGYHCAGRVGARSRLRPARWTRGSLTATSGGHAHEAARGGRRPATAATGTAACRWRTMVRDMRNRFLVALVFTIPIVAWSPVGDRAARHGARRRRSGIDREVWQLLLSLPIVLYASSIFFTGALAALRARTLDMMVLVAVAIGVGWIYSVAATFFIEGEVFYEAAAMLASFVLLGHWFEMRARGGANDAIRALLDLAPPKARRDPRRRAGRGADRRGRGRRSAARPARREGAGRRRGRRGRERGRRVDGHRREPAGLTSGPATS